MIIVNYGPASKFYDLFGVEDDIGFYKELAIKHGGKALELGVGTGRVAIELAKAGVNVWGIDNSKYMLKVAREKLRKEKASVRKRVILGFGDMRNFKLKETFPFIYMASSTFEHCITIEDQKKCLKSVYNGLKRKGKLAFDTSQTIDRKPENFWWIDRKELDAKEEVVRTIFSKRNSQSNVVSVNLFFDVYQNGKLRDRYYEYAEARMSSKEEIERLIENVGFEIDRVYGGFDKSPYHLESQKAIFIARKP